MGAHQAIARHLWVFRRAFTASPLASHFRLQPQPRHASIKPELLKEAREWYERFQESSLPQGETSFSRSSGPGGQHVNKTETKATTRWSVTALLRVLPTILHDDIRSSSYFTQWNDSLTMHAQVHRSRDANVTENRKKLFRELQELGKHRIPKETSPTVLRQRETQAKAANQRRLETKKFQSSKKASRRASFE
ncbi:hypothetical protein B0J18DRAFT_402718 [Chaetomium sp. MPI-SDFR-AT-0129]|nr:hypothetical protein B0J18DRAFT_402718 [Chaetomium sp. MPI-SDFR-AT-0129]